MENDRFKDFLYACKITIKNDYCEISDIVVLGKNNFSKILAELSYLKTESDLVLFAKKYNLLLSYGNAEVLKKFLPETCIWLNIYNNYLKMHGMPMRRKSLKKDSNANAIIIGQSGKGKSFIDIIEKMKEDGKLPASDGSCGFTTSDFFRIHPDEVWVNRLR